MRVLVFIDHMESGGAARVTAIMCKGLAQRGYDVVLAYNRRRNTLYDPGEKTQLADNSVMRHGKSHWAGIMLLCRRVIRYRQIIRETKPDIVIGIEPEPYLYARLAACCSRIPVIAVDHTSYRRKQHWFTRWIRWNAYRWADKVSILSHVDEAVLGKRLPNKTVIHNPLSFDICNGETERNRTIVCVGREDAWEIKGIDRMLRIWDTVKPQYPQWKLVIAGIKEKEPVTQVAFLGQVKDMKMLYQSAAVFALPSRVEGFPMSLLEAASQGCACIGFSLGGVTDEILTDQQSAFIIEDNNETLFAQQLRVLLEQDTLRQRFSRTAREQMQRFSEEQFINTWDQLCQSMQ